MDEAQNSSAIRRNLHAVLFVLAVAVYALVRLVGLTQFPIYFFSDEAVQTVLAADFVRDGFRSEVQELLPTFFKNSYQYNLGPSVYVQILPMLLFGKQIWVTRVVSVFFAVLAAVAVGLSVQTITRRKTGWLGVLLFSVMPAWFLHSRTAFETALSVSFYCIFILFYLLYRTKDRRFINLAALFAALAFYSYSPGQMVVGVTILALFLSDLKYHLEDRKILLRASLAAVVLALPYLRFLINHPGEISNHLQIVGAGWVANDSVWSKISGYLQEYLRGLNPAYWFLSNTVDLPRHTMKGYGHLWQPIAPFLLIGLALCLKNWRSTVHRVILICLLAAPSGAALAQIGITRALFMVLAATLLAAVGLLAVFDWLRRQTFVGCITNRVWTIILPVAAVLGLTAGNVGMLTDSLTNGPTWYTDYGLYGMQYGAKQIFSEIKNDLKADPKLKFVLTPAWANGTDTLARFFFDDPLPFSLGSFDPYVQNYTPLDAETVLIVLPNELEDIRRSLKFKPPRIEKTIPAPNGEPAFYYVRLEYVDNVEAVFAAEILARKALVSTNLDLQDGTPVTLQYSVLDMGRIQDVVDDDDLSVVRSMEANPFRFIFDFSEPRMVEQITLRVGGEPTLIEIDLWMALDSAPIQISQSLAETPKPRQVSFALDASQPLLKADIRVTNLNEKEPTHVHVWEIRFLALQSIP